MGKWNSKDDLVDFLKDASMSYYMGEPVMSDTEFDSLSASVKFNDVGYSSTQNRIPHMYRMYSLQKVFENEHEQKNPLKEYKGKLAWTPKLDGAAVSLIYFRGRLVQALTRGDGKKGIDITGNMSHLVPEEYNFSILHSDPFEARPYTQITGEVIAPKSIKNARNYAAGALNLKDIDEFNSRELKFIAYGVQPHIHEGWEADLKQAKAFGFCTVLDSNWNEYPDDGLVFRINNNEEFEKRGYTSHHPRGAYAFKTIQQGVETELVDVLWNVGKSGVVAPVAVLKPIEIDGAVVSRATLHNMAHIEALNLEIGCKVEVIRSGEIIPRIVRRI